MNQMIITTRTRLNLSDETIENRSNTEASENFPFCVISIEPDQNSGWIMLETPQCPRYMCHTEQNLSCNKQHIHNTNKTLVNRNIPLMKLTNSMFGANWSTLWTTTLVMCYVSVAERAATVWWTSAHTGRPDPELNEDIRVTIRWMKFDVKGCDIPCNHPVCSLVYQIEHLAMY